ncbi:hypothetical protein BDZ89DRAFT_1075968 [Hymenopellis radicata]|nr:hypothetical protein BDZ89DRAFT_1075968 [Hymenopellis radicata]
MNTTVQVGDAVFAYHTGMSVIFHFFLRFVMDIFWNVFIWEHRHRLVTSPTIITAVPSIRSTVTELCRLTTHSDTLPAIVQLRNPAPMEPTTAPPSGQPRADRILRRQPKRLSLRAHYAAIEHPRIPCLQLSFRPQLSLDETMYFMLPHGRVYSARSLGLCYSVQRVSISTYVSNDRRVGEEWWEAFHRAKVVAGRHRGGFWSRASRLRPRLVWGMTRCQDALERAVVFDARAYPAACYAFIDSERPRHLRAEDSALAVVYDVVQREDELYIIMDRYHHTLQDFLDLFDSSNDEIRLHAERQLTEEFVTTCAKRIFSAINEMHANNFCHANVNARSVLCKFPPLRASNIVNVQFFLGDFVKARRFKAARESFIQEDFSNFATLMDGLFTRLGKIRVAEGKSATPQGVRDLKRLMSFDDITAKKFVPSTPESCRSFANMFSDSTISLRQMEQWKISWRIVEGSKTTPIIPASSNLTDDSEQ